MMARQLGKYKKPRLAKKFKQVLVIDFGTE